MPFLEAVNAVGGEVQRQGAYVTQAFGAQREMLAAVADRPRPEEEAEFVALLEGTTEALACVDQAPLPHRPPPPAGCRPAPLPPPVRAASPPASTLRDHRGGGVGRLGVGVSWPRWARGKTRQAEGWLR